ncbi:MAG: hypothetical protein ACXWFB_06425 [Nitrososphaeraceae archaeon]
MKDWLDLPYFHSRDYVDLKNKLFEERKNHVVLPPLKDVFDNDMYNESTKCTMGELYQKTLDREEKLKELGYNVVSIWEQDFLNNL